MAAAPSVETTDEALVEAAQSGNVRALEALLERHQGRVLRVLRFLGVPPADREDVAQEVLLRVFRHLGGFRRGRSFAGWLYRVTVNAAHDYRTHRGRRAREEAPWPEDFESRQDVHPGPAQAARRHELRRALEGALGALSERERAAFVLCELEGLATREVARALGITAITVRRHLGRARARLRRILGPEEENAPAIERLAPQRGSHR